MKKTLQGYVESVLVGLDPKSLATTKRDEVNVTWEGFEGDRHSGITMLSDVRTPHYSKGTEIKNNRQISIVSVGELANIASGMNVPKLLPEWLGANLSLLGIPSLTFLPPGTRLFFPDDAVLVVGAENLPCINPGKIIQSQYPDKRRLSSLFPKKAMHKRGVVAYVERPGIIRRDDRINVIVPEQIIYNFA